MISLPVVVIVHGSQDNNALATIIWDCAFSEAVSVKLFFCFTLPFPSLFSLCYLMMQLIPFELVWNRLLCETDCTALMAPIGSNIVTPHKETPSSAQRESWSDDNIQRQQQ